jgi:hypothetical protein
LQLKCGLSPKAILSKYQRFGLGKHNNLQDQTLPIAALTTRYWLIILTHRRCGFGKAAVSFTNVRPDFVAPRCLLRSPFFNHGRLDSARLRKHRSFHEAALRAGRSQSAISTRKWNLPLIHPWERQLSPAAQRALRPDPAQSKMVKSVLMLEAA